MQHPHHPPAYPPPPHPHPHAYQHPYPHPHEWGDPSYDWDEPPRRRRLNGKGVAVVLALMALLALLFLGVLKLGLMAWHSPLTPVAANSAARIGTAIADAAMEEGEVPDQVREAVTGEADALRRQYIAVPARVAHRPTPTGSGVSPGEDGVFDLSDIADMDEVARMMDEQAPPRVD